MLYTYIMFIFIFLLFCTIIIEHHQKKKTKPKTETQEAGEKDELRNLSAGEDSNTDYDNDDGSVSSTQQQDVDADDDSSGELLTSLEKIGFQQEEVPQTQQQATINVPQQQSGNAVPTNPLLSQFQYQQSQNGKQANQQKQYSNTTGKISSPFCSLISCTGPIISIGTKIIKNHL